MEEGPGPARPEKKTAADRTFREAAELAEAEFDRIADALVAAVELLEGVQLGERPPDPEQLRLATAQRLREAKEAHAVALAVLTKNRRGRVRRAVGNYLGAFLRPRHEGEAP